MLSNSSPAYSTLEHSTAKDFLKIKQFWVEAWLLYSHWTEVAEQHSNGFKNIQFFYYFETSHLKHFTILKQSQKQEKTKPNWLLKEHLFL